MSTVYYDIDNLLSDVIENRVGVASLSTDLLADLLSRTAEILADDEYPETDENANDFQQLLEKIAVVMEQRAENDTADDVSSELLASLDRGNFCPAETNFTLH